MKAANHSIKQTCIEVQGIDHVVLRVRDLAASVAFYTSVLGMSVARERPDLGLIHLRAGASMLDLVAVDGPLGQKGGAAAEPTGRNLDHLCLRVEPFDERVIQVHLSAQGVALPEPAAARFGAEGIGPSLYIQDPDGNIIELKGSPAGKGA
ncbi:MAG: VOC family protein [Burkholderiaceae bacterium]